MPAYFIYRYKTSSLQSLFKKIEILMCYVAVWLSVDTIIYNSEKKNIDR